MIVVRDWGEFPFDPPLRVTLMVMLSKCFVGNWEQGVVKDSVAKWFTNYVFVGVRHPPSGGDFFDSGN